MIEYTDIIMEAYYDNHKEFLKHFNSKEKVSIRFELIDIMYMDWFIRKAELIERDLQINSFEFIQKCLSANFEVLSILAKDKRKSELIGGFLLMITTLKKMLEVMETAEKPTTFADYLKCDNKPEMIERISQLFDPHSKGAKVANVLKALEAMGFANYDLNTREGNNAKIKLYEAIKQEFDLTFTPESANKQFRAMEKNRTVSENKLKSIKTDIEEIKKSLES